MKQILLAIALMSASVSFSNNIEINTALDPKAEFDLLKKKRKFNRRAQYPAGFNIYGGGPHGLIGLSFDYFITPKIALEVGSGIRNFTPDVGFFAGGRYHFLGKTPLNLTPYLGVYSGFEYTGNDVRNYNLYVPFGIQRIKKNKIAWSIEVAYQRNSYSKGNNIYGGAKLGFRF
ncbi:MAG: hypothetical protein GQ574_07845 [Crocinitomix sp.]|nr:hypothetical protein [Crocinitomix sp.]